MTTRSAYDEAMILIGEVAHALLRGVKHYDKDGRPLRTVEAVLEVLLRDGKVEFEPPKPGEGAS